MGSGPSFFRLAIAGLIVVITLPERLSAAFPVSPAQRLGSAPEVAQPQGAAPSAAFRACMDRAGGVTSAMLGCGKTEIDRVDTRLNAAYRRLLTTLPAADAARLRVSQRAWLRHHLVETRRLAGAPDNGSLAFVDSQRFELQDLAERTVLLERMLATQRRP